MDGMANPGYALGQLAAALGTEAAHPDPEVRARARARVEAWTKVFQGMLTGALQVGSRAPVAGTPTWATLEVARGGFATGELQAAGALRPHEEALLERLGRPRDGSARAALNAWYLGDEGQAELRALLRSGCYRVDVPEEGALLVVAWLLEHGHGDLAREVLDAIGPFLPRLRFYPAPDPRPLLPTTLVHVQTVGETREQLQRVRGRESVEVQRETLTVWLPLLDRIVALFLETVRGAPPSLGEVGPSGQRAFQGGWPCQQYPEGWSARARAVLLDVQGASATHHRSRLLVRRGSTLRELTGLLERCVHDPRALTGYDVGQVRGILARILHRRGAPDSDRCRALRAAQARVAALPSRDEVARAVAARLEELPASSGLAEVGDALAPVRGAEVPRVVRRAVLRCLDAPVEQLVKDGVVRSGETLARVIPQLTGQVGAAGLEDADLRRLYGAIYGAFRRRRSLLLLNLEHQVRLSELPWVLAIDTFRGVDEDTQTASRRALEEVVLLALTSFPHTILPNKLLQELRALAQGAGLKLPIVDEVAADIFMGEFTEKYLDAARRAGALLAGTLYATYYGVEYARVRRIDDVKAGRFGARTSAAFIALCRERAGEDGGGGWSRGYVARNGKVIEQEQILTSHNLAVLVAELGLRPALQPRFTELARACFTWIVRSHAALARAPRRVRLRGVKNAAYAWRQLVFFLALVPPAEVADFVGWAREHLAAAGDDPRRRFGPLLEDLERSARGRPPRRRFLGWTTEEHWLLA